MKIQLFPGHALPPQVVAAWSGLQQKHSAYHSPYFRPEYVQAIAANRSDVEVAVLLKEGAPIGFFPFERHSWNFADPVGGRISDYQAVIVDPTVEWCPRELLDACRLRAYAFDHLLADQTPFAAYHAQYHESPYLDLSQGFEPYYQERRANGSLRVNQFLRKLRKLEREIGPLRFVAESRDQELLETLLAWKDDRYRESELANPFRQQKVLGMIQSLLACDTSAFAGILSALYAGDQLAAVLFSLRSHGVLHYCFPTYNESLKQYSPGSLLLTRLAQEAASLGITRIDLGKGKDEYKESFASGSTRIAEGSIDLLPMMGPARQAWRKTRDFVKGSRLYAPARLPIRWLRETLDWVAYR